MKNILITGSPGIGKTTLIKKIVDYLKSHSIECSGFYTEELRNNNYTVGFDIITLNGERGALARKGSNDQNSKNKPRVGQYEVYLEDFEKLALPVFEKPKRLLIIDEIGKMEMFSKKFEESVKNVMKCKDIQVIATVPLKGGPVLVKQLKEDKACQLITVNNSNRDNLLEDIAKLLFS